MNYPTIFFVADNIKEFEVAIAESVIEQSQRLDGKRKNVCFWGHYIHVVTV